MWPCRYLFHNMQYYATIKSMQMVYFIINYARLTGTSFIHLIFCSRIRSFTLSHTWLVTFALSSLLDHPSSFAHIQHAIVLGYSKQNSFSSFKKIAKIKILHSNDVKLKMNLNLLALVLWVIDVHLFCIFQNSLIYVTQLLPNFS